MKEIIYGMAAVILLQACGSGPGEKESAIDARMQSDLNAIQIQWTNLCDSMTTWKNTFSEAEKNWLSGRPMDSIKIALDKTSPILRPGWEQLYQQVSETPAMVDTLEKQFTLEIEGIRKGAAEFSAWKAQVESGEVAEQKARERFKVLNEKISTGRKLLGEWQVKWAKIVEEDSKTVNSFRSLY